MAVVLSAVTSGTVWGLLAGLLIDELLPTRGIKAQELITHGRLFFYVKDHARLLGIQKEVILIKGSDFCSWGNNILPGPAVIMVPDGAALNEQTQLEIIQKLAGIRANSGLQEFLGPVIIAAVVHWLFYSTFPIGCAMIQIAIVLGALGITIRNDIKHEEYANKAIGLRPDYNAP